MTGLLQVDDGLPKGVDVLAAYQVKRADKTTHIVMWDPMKAQWSTGSRAYAQKYHGWNPQGMMIYMHLLEEVEDNQENKVKVTAFAKKFQDFSVANWTNTGMITYNRIKKNRKQPHGDTTHDLEQHKCALDEVDTLMGWRHKKKWDKANNTTVVVDTPAQHNDVHKEPTAMTAEQIAAVVQWASIWSFFYSSLLSMVIW